MAFLRLAQYASSSDSVTHTITLDSPVSGGHSLMVIAVSSATISGLSGSNWVNVTGITGASDVRMYRLPAAYANGLTSFTVTLSTSSSFALVAWQDTINETSSNNYYDISRSRAPIYAGTVWGTDLHSFSGVDVAMAVFIGGQMSPESGDITGYDQSFTEFADSGIVGTTAYDKYRIWLASNEITSMVNNGITATLNPNFQTTGSSQRVGMIAYKRLVLGTKPIAIAGESQSVAPGALVTLDAGSSYDPNGTISSYNWTQTAGPLVTLSDSHAAQATFTAPSTSTTCNFELIVTDNDGEVSEPVSTSVTTGSLRVLKSYNGSTPQLTHTIALDVSSDPGKDVFVVAMSDAVITGPPSFTPLRAWTNTADTRILHLPASANTGINSIDLTLSEARPLAAVVMDDVAKVRNFVTTKGSSIAGGDMSWYTATESFGQSDEALVFYAYKHDDVPADNQILSYSNGYTEIANTGAAGSGGVGNESVHIFVAQKRLSSLTGQSVVGTLASGYSGYEAIHGMIAYDRSLTLTNTISSYSNDVMPPEGTWFSNQGSLTLGTTITIEAEVQQLKKWRLYYRPEMGALQAALYTLHDSFTPLVVETLPSDTMTGWREIELATPIDLVKGTTYIVSYYSPNMFFYADIGGFPAVHYGDDDLGPLSMGDPDSRGVTVSAHMYSTDASLAKPNNIALSGRSYYIDYVISQRPENAIYNAKSGTWQPANISRLVGGSWQDNDEYSVF